MAKSVTKEHTGKLVMASARQLHISPRKIRLVTNLLKGVYAVDALAQLSHLNKKGAPMVAKLLQSALANAENNFALKPEDMYIKSITADMGAVMKRYFPRARGSAFVIRRKMAHVNVVLEEKKRKGGSAARAAMFKKFAEKSEEKQQAVESKAANADAGTVESKPAVKRAVPKTGEQKKMNTVQQKRRLFNRKAGE